MRTRTLLLAQVSVMGVFAAVLGSCGPSVIDRSPPERPVYVEIPASGVATPAQKARYENNPVAVVRFERRCTYKPGPLTVCNSSVELKIEVLEGAKHVRAGGHHFGPHLLAKIQNLGATATFDSIMPGEQALVAVGKGAQTALRLVRFHQMANSPNFAVVAPEYRILKDCHPYSARSSDMSFRGCDPKHYTTRRGNFQQGVLATGLMTVETHSFGGANGATLRFADMYSMDDPLWLRCSPGCCTS